MIADATAGKINLVPYRGTVGIGGLTAAPMVCSGLCTEIRTGADEAIWSAREKGIDCQAQGVGQSQTAIDGD